MPSDLVLGFDFGTKSIGVAVGESLLNSARPLDSLKAVNGKPNKNSLEDLISRWQPKALVVGIPLNMDGSVQELTLKARKFANSLGENFKLPVFHVDERLTTREARSRAFAELGYKGLQKEKIDSFAAKLILEQWLSG